MLSFPVSILQELISRIAVKRWLEGRPSKKFTMTQLRICLQVCQNLAKSLKSPLSNPKSTIQFQQYASDGESFRPVKEKKEVYLMSNQVEKHKLTRYCIVTLVKCKQRWLSTVEKPSFGKHETWNSSSRGTANGSRICLILSSVQRGRSRLPMLVTLKFLRLLDFDKKWERLVKLILKYKLQKLVEHNPWKIFRYLSFIRSSHLDRRRFRKLTNGTVLAYKNGMFVASILNISFVGFSMCKNSRLGHGYTNLGKWK